MFDFSFVFVFLHACVVLSFIYELLIAPTNSLYSRSAHAALCSLSEYLFLCLSKVSGWEEAGLECDAYMYVFMHV